MSDAGPVEPHELRGAERSRLLRKVALILAVLLVVGAVGAGGWMAGSGNAKTRDVLVEPADSVGPDPFTTEGIAPTVQPSPSPTGAPVNATGLYGGSGDNGKCDPDKLAAFLMAHPDKAMAWVGALNSDPSLSWSGGDFVQVSDIPAYIKELRPTILSRDVMLTNHGYANGKATARQSLLKKGTAVLLGKGDKPRVRCFCGNPLVPGTGDPTTATIAPTTTSLSSTTVQATTTTGDIDFQAECEAIAPIPGGATNVTSAPADYNGDGTPDVLRVYQLGPVWRVRAEIGGTGVADETLSGPGPAMTAIGGATVDSYPGEEAWVKVGSGSSTDIIALLMLLDCDFKQVMLNGSPAEFPIGATGTAADGLGCYGFDVGIEVFTSTSSDGVTYAGTSQIYTIDLSGPNPVFVLGATASQSATNPSPAFTAMSGFNCDTLNTIP